MSGKAQFRSVSEALDCPSQVTEGEILSVLTFMSAVLAELSVCIGAASSLRHASILMGKCYLHLIEE